ncbi:MAG: argininosuccinate lyase, partial [Acetobacteraceae bacterium]
MLTGPQSLRLGRALGAMRRDLASGAWTPAGAEDVHTAIEAEVTRRVGALGERLHTGRSRNDQVSTALRLCVAQRLQVLRVAVGALQAALVRRAAAAKQTLMPAYTHVQRAQPITLAHFLLAHFWPLERDVARLRAAQTAALCCPLGAGAVSGHPFGLDRAWVARRLGFVAVSQNSLDTVGDRDFAVEAVFACSLLATHLSRLGEDLVLFSSSEFGFVVWPD